MFQPVVIRDVLDHGHDFAHVDVPEQHGVFLEMSHTLRNLRRLCKDGMWKNGASRRVEQRRRLFAVVTCNGTYLDPVKPFSAFGKTFGEFAFAGQRGTRPDDPGNLVFGPQIVDGGVQRMVGHVQGNGRFVPIQDQTRFVEERQHVIHGHQIRSHVADHDFDLTTVAVVDLVNAARFAVAREIHRRIVVQSDVRCRLTSKGKGDTFLHRNGTARQCEAHVARRANIDDAVRTHGQTQWTHRLACACGGRVQYQHWGDFFFGFLTGVSRSTTTTEKSEQLFLMVIELAIVVAQYIGIAFDDIVGVVEYLAHDR